MLFDEGVLQQKGIRFGFHYGEFNAAGIFHHHAGAVGAVLALPEVRRDPVAQVLSLAHIQYGILLIDKPVHPGLPGDGIRNGLEVCCGHAMLVISRSEVTKIINLSMGRFYAD